jgi:putative methyltransferase
MVLLLDYQQNGFFFGNERKKTAANEAVDVLPDISEIQEALVSHRTKLRAALARSRVRDCAISVEALLPKEEQEKIQYAAAQPVYARVNSLKTNLDEVLETLKNDGFSLEEKLPEREELTGKYFCKDQHFDNLLVFSQEAKYDLHGHDLVQDGHLVIQVIYFTHTPFV